MGMKGSRCGLQTLFLWLGRRLAKFYDLSWCVRVTANLYANVTYWLTYSDGKTHIMILLSINRIDQQILVEQWEEVPKTQPSWSTTNYSHIPRMI
jgi:hypothetical protein